MAEDWTQQFPELVRLPPELREALRDGAHLATVPSDHLVFSPGQRPENLLLLRAGRVRVQHRAESGREIVLYRVTAGESCALTTACLLAGEDYEAEGVSETEVEAALIPRALFDQLLTQSDSFRRLVFAAHAHRMADLFRVIEQLAFGRIGPRLAQRLLDLAQGAEELQATHQQLATELGSAREVISRQLQAFQKQGLIAQSRGTIRFLDIESLTRVAQD
ncbi:MAG: Crp/Fnr family transcriptional regulator [Pseudomonadota bacterium]